MKKTMILLLAAFAAVCLCACGSSGEPEENQMITRAAEDTVSTTAPAETEAAAVSGEAEFAPFLTGELELMVGTAFDPSALPEANSVYEIPSCAFEGTDNVYSYDAFEITAFHNGTEEIIYSVYLMSPDVTTPEGLALGDPLERVLELYGENYEQSGTAYNYCQQDAMLSILVQGDAVISIEYRWLYEG